MRLATFNVNSIRSRLEIVQNFINDYNIDILCMQEIKTENKNFPLLNPEMECVIHGQKRLHGVAICSKFPIEEKITGFSGERDEARFIYSKIAGIDIVNIYAPLGDLYGEKFEYKMFFYNELFKFVEKFLDKDFLICGDFNIVHQNIDVFDANEWQGNVTFLPEERAILSKFLDLGLVDITREYFEDEKVFTFYDYRGGAVYKNRGLRLDYILTSKSLAKKVVSVEIPLSIRRKRKPTPSDHVPLIAEFRI